MKCNILIPADRVEKLRNAKRRIKRLNAKFKAASSAEKRVMIAKDVLARLKSRQYEADHGNWSDLGRTVDFKYRQAMREAEYKRWNDKETGYTIYNHLQEVSDIKAQVSETSVQSLILAGETCTVCALGGILTSCIAIKNQLTVGEMDDKDILNGNRLFDKPDHLGIRKLFGIRQLALIEYTFEGGEGRINLSDVGFYFDIELAQRALDFHNRYCEDTQNLQIKIMENLIENNGTFKP